MTNPRPRRTGTRVLGSFAMIAIAACGGGGGSQSPSGGSPAPGSGVAPPGPTVGTALPGPRPTAKPRSFVTFESGQVRPLALSPGGQHLYAVNTPDNRLEIFSLAGGDPLHQESVPVGMEPVAVAVGPDDTVWVVNHLSDSISVVATGVSPARTIATLQVGDEPGDIVIAGIAGDRVFVTSARRGQNLPLDPQFERPGTARALLWVFDATAVLGQGETEPLAILQLFGDTPRALAASPDGSRVYAAIFKSGNRTTILAPNNLAKAPPRKSADGVTQPDSGLIVRFADGHWVDDSGQIFDQSVPFTLPDRDVFEIDASVDPPRFARTFTGVGTALFNMVVNPADGTVYVSNIDARNHVRFSGRSVGGSTTIRGHAADNRITLLDDAGVRPRNLNKHIDFSREQGTAAERALSLSSPMGMAVSADGRRLYLAAFGSRKLAIFDTASLSDDSFRPDANAQVELSAGGPSGLVLDELRGRAYVMTRFDNGISVIDLATNREVSHLRLFNPEPASVVAGRRFLYDARLTSGNGNDSCHTCHLFGDTDGLAWDLGKPSGVVAAIPNMFINISPPADPRRFHPMKGPMTTQTMRGLSGHGPMHWRGDRTGANRLAGETIEEAAFKEFNEAFDDLMGRDGPISDADMQAFTDFAMQIAFPPNPVRSLDNSLNALEQRGADLYRTGVVRIQTGIREVCIQCHPISPSKLQFGTAGLMADNSQPGERNFKIPHFRDFYQKVGMFGWGFNSPPATGAQVRGFGYNHNGATTSNFIIADLGMPADDLSALRAFLLAFPSESAPVLGQQVTLRHDNADQVAERLQLLVTRAMRDVPIPECELVVKGIVGGSPAGWLMASDGTFTPDRGGPPAALDELRSIASQPGQALTFTCAPWGSGQRMGVDRDLDGIPDGEDSVTE